MIAQVGFSGTREGCTPAQLVSLWDVLLDLVADGAWELHHGDCAGADVEAHVFWRACRQRVVLHPPTSTHHRGLCDHDDRRPPAPHLERNDHIVAAVQVLVAAPPSATRAEAPRSGTWYTVERALEAGRVVIVVLPDGSVQQRTHAQGTLQI